MYEIEYTDSAQQDLAYFNRSDWRKRRKPDSISREVKRIIKAVNVSQRSKVLNDLFKRARRNALVLKLPTGEEFVLARLSQEQSFFVGEDDDFDVEVEMMRQNKAFMKFLDARGAEAKKKKKIPAEEVRRNLGF